VITYLCRVCRKPLCASDATAGRAQFICRFCNTAQMIFFGNPDGKPLPRESRLTTVR
jgi:hypothetical protein